MEREVKISVITLGDSGVGKTSIIKRIYDGTFQDVMFSTFGIGDFFVRRKYSKKNIQIVLCFKDTAGQESYQELPVQYIRKSHIVLFVFCDIKTLNTLRERWYNFYKQKANIENSRFILVGNKSDLFGNEKKEIERQGQEFADEINAHFITCSAKSKDNMDTLEQIIIDEAKNFIEIAENYIKERDNVQLNNQNNQNNNRRCC